MFWGSILGVITSYKTYILGGLLLTSLFFGIKKFAGQAKIERNIKKADRISISCLNKANSKKEVDKCLLEIAPLLEP